MTRENDLTPAELTRITIPGDPAKPAIVHPRTTPAQRQLRAAAALTAFLGTVATTPDLPALRWDIRRNGDLIGNIGVDNDEQAGHIADTYAAALTDLDGSAAVNYTPKGRPHRVSASITGIPVTIHLWPIIPAAPAGDAEGAA